MKNKLSLSKLFDNKRFLQIFSVVVAVLLYFIVAMTTTEDRTITISGVPVSLDAQAANLTNLRLSAVEGQEYYVDIVVNGPLSVVGQLGADSPELATTARVSQIIEAGTYPLPVTSAYSGTLPFKIVSYSPRTIDVRFDRITSKSFDIIDLVNGLSTPPPYVFDKTFPTPSKVTVTGPVAEVEKIAKCEVEINLKEPLEGPYAPSLPIILRDAQGEVIDPLSRHLTLSETEVQLVISVLKETELPLTVKFLNPPRSFPLDALQDCMTMSNQSLRVQGPADVVDKLTEIKLGDINIKELRVDDNANVFQLELPAGVESSENISSVTVQFEDSGWDAARFNITDVEVVSPPADLNVTPLSTRLDNVEFVGNQNIIASMTTGDIVAEIDLSDRALTVGQYSYPVKISVPGKGLVWAVGDYSVVIQVTEKD